MRLRIGLLLLAVAASLAFVGKSEARPWGERGVGGGYYGGYYGSPSYGYNPYGYYGGFNNYGYYGNSYYPYAYDYQTSPFYYSYSAMPMTSTYQSFYSGPTTDSNAALINVQVPADAELMIGNSTTQQRGANRSFVSPPLEQGKTYSYDIKARWMQNGQPVEQTRHVQIRAGDQVRVDFANAAGASTTGAAYMERGGNAYTDPRYRRDVNQPEGAARFYNGNGPATQNGTVINGVFVPARTNALQPAGVVNPGANANQPAGVNPSNQPSAGTTNPNQFPPAGQNNPNNPNQVPAGQNNPNQLPAGSNNPNQLPAGQTNPNTPVTPTPGQTAPSPSIVPPKQ